MGSISRPGNLWNCRQPVRGDVRHHHLLLQLLARRHAGHGTENELQYLDDGQCRVVRGLLLRHMGEEDLQGAHCGDLVHTDECEVNVGSQDDAGNCQGFQPRQG